MRLVRPAVLELHDVGRAGCPDHGIDAARGRADLGLDVGANQLEYEVELGLEGLLVPGGQVVGDAGEEGADGGSPE